MMETKNENACPHCGHKILVRMEDRCHFRPVCEKCGSQGPEVPYFGTDYNERSRIVVAALRYPAHLMSSLRTYDPATEVKVSREAADGVLTLIKAWARQLNAIQAKPSWGIIPDFDRHVAELRAALEVEE